MLLTNSFNLLKDLYGINPDEIIIEGFSSLKSLSLRFESLNHVKLTNLFALRILQLNGKLSYFNLDSFSNLKELHLNGTILYDFNFDLFDSLCNHLEYIDIRSKNLDDKYLEKLFYGRNFPYLTTFDINGSSAMIKLEKKLFDGLQTLQKLTFLSIKNLRIIDAYAFSNLINLEELELSDTCIEFIDKTTFSNLINLKTLTLQENQIESIEEYSFSSLHNLEYLNLSSNRLTLLNAKTFVGLDNLKELDLNYNELVNFDLDIFDNIGKFVEIELYGNSIINKDEILNRSLQSNIKVNI